MCTVMDHTSAQQERNAALTHYRQIGLEAFKLQVAVHIVPNGCDTYTGCNEGRCEGDQAHAAQVGSMQCKASLEHNHTACYLQQGLPTDQKAGCSHPIETLHRHQWRSSVVAFSPQQGLRNKHTQPQQGWTGNVSRNHSTRFAWCATCR